METVRTVTRRPAAHPPAEESVPQPAAAEGLAAAKQVPVVPDAEHQALQLAFPVGSRQRFRTYHPAIWPRDWRRAAERAAWGLRPDDLLEVTGYGATWGFPEALLLRRVRDGTTAMIFPVELAPGTGDIPVVGLASGAAATADVRQHLRATQQWEDDGGRRLSS